MTPADQIRMMKKEIRFLKKEILANRAQEQLFELLIEMAGSAPDRQLLKVTMQKALEATARLSGADTGSLFLLNEQGRVTDSLLTRGEVDPELRSALIGSVLDEGLAGWVRAHLRAGLIRDTLKDSRWLSLPEEPYSVRSALAVPIIRHKSLFGILTLMHPDPGFFDRESKELVKLAASQMALAIEMAQLYIKSEELHRLREKALERDLQLAREVQKSFLPTQVPQVGGYRFAALNQPAHEVGGDLYHFFKLPKNRLGIAIGDVSGKGIAAALFMARLGSDLQYYAPLCDDPAGLFLAVNEVLYERSKQGMFVTLIYAVLDIGTGELAVANAGHIPPVFIGNTIDPIPDIGESVGPPLGIIPDAVYETQTFRLSPGQGILLYTDGIIEAKNGEADLYGSRRLDRLVTRYPSDPDTLIRQITRSVAAFSHENGQSDDLTLVGILRE